MTEHLEMTKELIENSFFGVRNKDVKSMLDMDLMEVAYKTLVVLEDGFGKEKPENRWNSVKPMTNVASELGRLVLVGNQQEDDDIAKRNLARFKVGYHLLHVFVNAGILEFVRGDQKRDKYRIRVVKGAEDTFEEFMAQVDSIEVEIPIYTRPQFTKPMPFTSFYHPEAGSMVRNVNPEAIRHINMYECPKVFEVINKHMEVAYEINRDVLEVYMNSLEDDIFTFKNKDLDEEQLGGLERERDKVLELASWVGERTFWEYMFYDSRSRLYSSSVYLSHAASKLSKSLYLYNEKKPIGSEGWFWLLVHTANCFGYDKDSIDGRYEFAEGKLDQWVQIGKDPIKNKLWQKADSPFEFLAAVIEIYKAVKSGDRYNYESGLAAAWDASCSGLQVLSALAKDHKSGALCNLTDAQERGDYYLMIADEVWKECVYDQSEEKMFKQITADLAKLDKKVSRAFKSGKKDRIKEALAERKEYHSAHKANIYDASKVFWGRPEMAKLRRKICKRPCMTYFYSCGAKTMSKAMMNDHSADEEYAGINSYYCFWLAKRIYGACERLMPVPTSLMSLFIRLGLDDYNNGQDFSIYSPLTNFKMMQYYRQDITRQVKMSYKGKEIKPVVTIGKNEKIDRSKVLSATSPNVVHMLDAQIVAGIILKASYTVSSIHDSFSTHLADAGKLYEDCRNVFVELFSEDVLFDMLEQKDSLRYYDEIAKGKLDLEDTRENEHCFS